MMLSKRNYEIINRAEEKISKLEKTRFMTLEFRVLEIRVFSNIEFRVKTRLETLLKLSPSFSTIKKSSFSI